MVSKDGLQRWSVKMVSKMVSKKHKKDSNYSINSKSAPLTLSKTTQLLLMLSLGLNCLSLVLELSGWLIAFIMISIFWQVSIYLQLIRKPERVVKLLVAIAGLFLLALSAKELGLLNAMVHLLVFSYLLKPLELNTKKDFYIEVLLGIFVLVTSLVFIQSLYFMIMILLILIVNFMLLMSLFDLSHSKRVLAKRVGVVLLQSFPVALLLFVGFPKIAPFWQMPTVKSAQVGLSDEVKVGDIANLALSNALAFRVEFEQAPPSYQQMYWRTLVLEDYDGVKWYQNKKKSYWQQQQVTTPETYVIKGLSVIPTFSYQVIVEPNFQHWLFGLNVITEVSNKQQKIKSNSDFTISANKKLNSVTSYSLKSALTDHIDIPLSTSSRQRNLYVTHNKNEKLFKEGQHLRTLYQDDLAIVNAVLKRFNQQNYHYTLNPPTLTNNNLAEFYFDTKAGFCEHYASSFTYLMRAAGIPARMVLGYLGGEYNARGNYYSIYQRDAHAWSEVWIKDKGWLRIDPTAAVNPERVEKGFSQILQQEQSLLSSELFSSFNTNKWLIQLRYMFEAIDYQWTKWVVGYSINDQVDVLKAIGAIFVNNTQTIIAIFFVLVLLIMLFIIAYKKSNKASEQAEIVILNQLLNLLDKKGITRTPSMTIDQLAAQLIIEKPEIKAPVLAFVKVFKKIHYEKITSTNKMQNIIFLKQEFNHIKQSI